MSETPRKPTIPKDGILPALTRLKKLEKHHRESIIMWLEDKPQSEVAVLIERNFSISCASSDSWPATLTRFHQWMNRQPEIEAANAFAEFLQNRLESSQGLPVAQIRSFVLETLTLIADQSRSPEILLPLARELRATDSLELAKDKWLKAKQTKLDAGLDALFGEIKGSPRALEIFENLKAEIAKQ